MDNKGKCCIITMLITLLIPSLLVIIVSTFNDTSKTITNEYVDKLTTLIFSPLRFSPTIISYFQINRFADSTQAKRSETANERSRACVIVKAELIVTTTIENIRRIYLEWPSFLVSLKRSVFILRSIWWTIWHLSI